MNNNWKKITLESYNKHADDFALHAKAFTSTTWVDKFINKLDKGAKV
jgi:hypothetical protein